ncbi:MAG: hypothetical protein K8I82_30200, partial [Anaerolineae bacterium]|nr:hypothetical protein [Anaerolineae bacterium]
ITPDEHYAVSNLIFSPDGATLLLDGSGSLMILGIPTASRPAWQPVMGRIIPSGVNLRAAPFTNSDVIGIVSGEVMISGRSSASNAVYLPELEGWIWADSNYLDLGDHVWANLPVIYVTPDE